MSPELQKAYDGAAKIFDAELGKLPEYLAKVLRAGINTGPNAPLVAAWCAENPTATAKIVGAVAMVQAVRINEQRRVHEARGQ